MSGSMLLRRLQPQTRLKVAASAVLAVPIVLLLLLTVGEMAEGDPSGAQHLVQAAPLVLLLIAAWRYPGAVGLALLCLSPLLLALWLVFVLTSGSPSQDTPLLIWVGVGFVLFAPPVVAGWLLLKAGRAHPGA